MKSFKVLLFVLVFLFLVLFASCINSDVLIPDELHVEKAEIPGEVFEAIQSVTDLTSFLWRNYNYTKDENWSGYRDYPLTPAEWYMSRIRDVNYCNRIIEKRPYIGDCEDYAALAAYLLWRALGFEAYVAVIPDFTEPNIGHMICFGYGPRSEFVVVNAPWVSEKYKSIEEYMNKVYPGKRVVDIMPIEIYLEDLYAKGHHRYWDEEI